MSLFDCDIKFYLERYICHVQNIRQAVIFVRRYLTNPAIWSAQQYLTTVASVLQDSFNQLEVVYKTSGLHNV